MITSTPFTPHNFDELVAMRAFPEGAMPEPAYSRYCSEYTAIDDVEVSRITYPSPDGLSITGIVALPKNAQNADLVIYNRGGSGNYGILTVRSVMTQFIPLARAGYVVAGSNYRGNDGSEGKDEFGGRDVDDVIALHDLARKELPVNQKPCFTIGHSRGGLMTYLLMKHGLPMRAAIAIAAVSDLRGWNNARSQMVETVYKRFIPGFEANAEALLSDRSALCWPQALTSPLLLLHGTKDDRVPHTQSEELAALLTNPHELVLFEGGNHSLLRHWDEVLKRTLDWMARYA